VFRSKFFQKIIVLITKIFTMVNIQLDKVIHKCTMIWMVNHVEII